jgi:hypothetical protein
MSSEKWEKPLHHSQAGDVGVKYVKETIMLMSAMQNFPKFNHHNAHNVLFCACQNSLKKKESTSNTIVSIKTQK